MFKFQSQLLLRLLKLNSLTMNACFYPLDGVTVDTRNYIVVEESIRVPMRNLIVTHVIVDRRLGQNMEILVTNIHWIV